MFVGVSFQLLGNLSFSDLGFVFLALSLLLVPTYYKKITEQTKSSTKKAGYIIFATKAFAGIATILILKATELGDVAVVQALGGLQFVFLLLLGIVFCRSLPHAFGEHSCRKGGVLQKSLFVAMITLGFIMLFR